MFYWFSDVKLKVIYTKDTRKAGCGGTYLSSQHSGGRGKSIPVSLRPA